MRRVDDGDVRRAATVAEHLRVVLQMLAHHHENEDELAFPPLAERTSGEEAALIQVMEDQHEVLERGLEQIRVTLPTWRTSADATSRDALASALEDLHVALGDHLDLEERSVLPMAERLLTDAEWDAIGAHGEKGAEGRDKLVVFGMLVYQGDPAVVATMLASAPRPVRALLPRLAMRTYRRHATKVHGTPTP